MGRKAYDTAGKVKDSFAKAQDAIKKSAKGDWGLGKKDGGKKGGSPWGGNYFKNLRSKLANQGKMFSQARGDGAGGVNEA